MSPRRHTLLVATALVATLLGVSASAAIAAPADATAAAGIAALPAAPADQLTDWQKGQWWVDAIKLKERHAAGITGAGVTIALLNGPVSTSVPELQGQDVRPTASNCQSQEARWGPLTPDVPLSKTSFHTTSMAALLVGNGKGNGPNGTGVLGVAPGATLRTYALFNTLDPAAHQDLDCDPAALPQLIDRVVADGANVVEIPQGLQVGFGEFQAAVNRAINKGVMFVIGAGNGGANTIPMKPANTTGFLIVGGLDQNGNATADSPTSLTPNWATAQLLDSTYDIHVMAPGVDIIGGSVSNGAWTSDVLQSGTSGSSAIVAGQLALMKQKWPKATSNQLLYSLLRNARRTAGAPPWSPRTGFGATSFQATLTTDPSVYPDVMPFYNMKNVVLDNPDPPFIPEQVDENGHLPTPPPSGTASSTPPSTASAPSATNGSAPPPVVAAGEVGGSSGAPLGWLLAGAVLLLIIAVVVLLILRNRRARPTIHTPDTPPPAVGVGLGKDTS